MSHIPYYKPGEWLAECMICGRVFRGTELRRNWVGQYVCNQDFEVKHPQLSVIPSPDLIRVPFVSSEPPDTFIITDDGYWAYDPTTDGVGASVGYIDCYASEDGNEPKERLSGNLCYVTGTT